MRPGSVVLTSSQATLCAVRIERYPEIRSVSFDAVGLNQAAACELTSGSYALGFEWEGLGYSASYQALLSWQTSRSHVNRHTLPSRIKDFVAIEQTGDTGFAFTWK